MSHSALELWLLWGSKGHTLGVHGPWAQRELTTAPWFGEVLPDVQDKHVLCLASWPLGCREEGCVGCGRSWVLVQGDGGFQGVLVKYLSSLSLS